MRDFPDMHGPMAYWPAIEVVEGVTGALQNLARSVICCVASNAGASDAELMALAFQRAGIRGYFQYFFTSKELGASKPDRRVFNEVARRVGVPPSECGPRAPGAAPGAREVREALRQAGSAQEVVRVLAQA